MFSPMSASFPQDGKCLVALAVLGSFCYPCCSVAVAPHSTHAPIRNDCLQMGSTANASPKCLGEQVLRSWQTPTAMPVFVVPFEGRTQLPTAALSGHRLPAHSP